VVTNKMVLGKLVDHLDLPGTCGVSITRINRAGIEFIPHQGARLQFGDTLVAVGDSKGLLAAEQLIGNSTIRLNQPQVMTMFIGIALGVCLGMVPLAIPGIPVPVKLGLAGGPLLVALVLTRVGSVRGVAFYLPPTAGQMLRDFGISCFLAAVGLSSGEAFLATVANAKGVFALGCGFVITTLPLLVVGVLARKVMKMNFSAISGILAGSMTDPPALAFANSVCGSEAPSASYATVYPLAMLLRVVTAQLLVLVLMSGGRSAPAGAPPADPPAASSAVPVSGAAASTAH
jgi:putative transport protein